VLNNIIGIIDNNGTIVSKFDYDAFGNIINQTGSVISNFRYKGYYYDTDIELYYLKSRFYNPVLLRFITPDSIEYLDSSSVIGLNLYAYCGNDPVNKYDPTGHFPLLILAAVLLFTPVGGTALQVATSVLSYAGMAVASIFDEDIRNDMNAIGWNPFNTDESATLNSSKVSFYKGVPVFRTAAGGRSGSFGAIFLTKGSGVDTLRHERGHNWQLMMMGIGTYGFTVGIPSPSKLGKWDKDGNYYGAPWETMADILGGVKGRTHSSTEIWNAWGYYAVSTLCFPFTALYWL
ncbi:MAG: RHS repeat-associated core domain-containing protein, partial [Anaeroplasma sp.]|uniref:RHS repeat-associated core domain-containing protein n=1 Tax=Anaeroplasma sp. TaxID=1872523 RepID=UPI002A90D4BF